MQLIVGKSRLKGSVIVPSSKSHTIRAVAIASLAEGPSDIHSPLVSGDTISAVNCYRALGAKIYTLDNSSWRVIGTAGLVRAPEKVIDVGNSGTTLRMAIGSASLVSSDKTVTFTGDEQIRSRPLKGLMKSLEDLGAKCVSIENNGKAPIAVTGQLKGGKTSIEAFTSQYLSSLLLCAPLAKDDSVIDVTLLHEPGYVQMTLDWLNKQKIQYDRCGLEQFKIKGDQKYQPFEIKIPADFSSATFFLCAAALAGDNVKLFGLDLADSQPDRAVLEYLHSMGADINVDKKSIMVKASSLKGIDIDMNATPDALPAMAVLGAFAEGQTRLLNVPQARKKETDRIKCMTEELKKLGADVEELEDGLVVRRSKLKAAHLDGREDHRIVMALSLAGMVVGDCTISTAEAMNVTFPEYVELMTNIGANMELR